MQGRVGVRLRQVIKHWEASFPRLMEWDVGSSSVPTKGHPSWKAFFRGQPPSSPDDARPGPLTVEPFSDSGTRQRSSEATSCVPAGAEMGVRE